MDESGGKDQCMDKRNIGMKERVKRDDGRKVFAGHRDLSNYNKLKIKLIILL